MQGSLFTTANDTPLQYSVVSVSVRLTQVNTVVGFEIKLPQSVTVTYNCKEIIYFLGVFEEASSHRPRMSLCG